MALLCLIQRGQEAHLGVIQLGGVATLRCVKVATRRNKLRTAAIQRRMHYGQLVVGGVEAPACVFELCGSRSEGKRCDDARR